MNGVETERTCMSCISLRLQVRFTGGIGTAKGAGCFCLGITCHLFYPPILPDVVSHLSALGEVFPHQVYPGSFGPVCLLVV